MADISHTTVVDSPLVSTDRLPMGRPSDGNADGAGTAYTLTVEQMTNYVGNNLVVSKASGDGIKVDIDTPTYGWNDLFGVLKPDPAGANSPNLGTFRDGAARTYFYNTNDQMDMEFHIPHDYAPGTDLYVHLHWSHNGTAISGNFVVTLTSTYSKGHAQDIFSAEKVVTVTYDTVDITTTPRYVHRIDEVQLTTSGGTASLLDTDVIEPDGIIIMNMNTTTIPSITGGSVNRPTIFFVDIHYQSTNIATKQKAPDFYV